MQTSKRQSVFAVMGVWLGLLQMLGASGAWATPLVSCDSPLRENTAVTPATSHVEIEGRAIEDVLIAWRAVVREFKPKRSISSFQVHWAQGDGITVVTFGRAWTEDNTLKVECYNTNIRNGRVVFVERCQDG